jgi:DedD protein
MDQQLKARLIGAAVLVAIAVIVIPELLSGRKAVEPSALEPAVRGKRTYTIDLGGGTPGGASSPTLVPEPALATTSVPQPAQEPQPAEAVPAAAPSDESVADVESSSVEMPPPAREDVQSPPPAREEAQPPPPPVQEAARSSGGGWAVQVGAFGSAGAAQKLVTQLAGQGYAAFVSPIERGGKTLHRVRVGPEPDRAATDRLAQQLKARGLPATVVSND